MSYVLKYTIVPPNGEIEQREGTTHRDALMSYVKGLLGMATQDQIDKATHEAIGGEIITVVGYSQTDYSNWRHRKGSILEPQNIIVQFRISEQTCYKAEVVETNA